ncbi:nucleoside deaminase [Mesoplasma syrphidae]|uniref:Nucleoside deaminase n=1 Tax=Mesoplasma syrphidae TaxID=225999 RepID=A0A2K9C356_9MOLU|nr:nucleoside deaminase [Mesoplasma syrphidae]AUF83909.1 nucleoside deaminase [Mesoplasma syrphidae]
MKESIFELLIKTAKLALETEDIPVAAIVINQDNKITGVGFNTRNKEQNIACHAEINAINQAIKNSGVINLSGYKIISTLEPCEMCYGAIKQAKIKEINFILSNAKYGINNIYSINDIDIKIVKIGNIQQQNNYQELLETFFKNKR